MQMLKRLEAEGRPVRTGDDEVDRLVRDSILVLRMNLVELAKVADLCDDFRSRYIRELFDKDWTITQRNI